MIRGSFGYCCGNCYSRPRPCGLPGVRAAESLAGFKQVPNQFWNLPVFQWLAMTNPDSGCPFCKYCRHGPRSEEHTSELQSRPHLVCRLLLEKKKKFFIYISLLYTSAF